MFDFVSSANVYSVSIDCAWTGTKAINIFEFIYIHVVDAMTKSPQKREVFGGNAWESLFCVNTWIYGYKSAVSFVNGMHMTLKETTNNFL